MKLLFVYLLCLPIAFCSLELNVGVQNSPVKIIHSGGFILYDSTGKISREVFPVCKNQVGARIFFEVGVRDNNTIEEISRYGNVSYLIRENNDTGLSVYHDFGNQYRLFDGRDVFGTKAVFSSDYLIPVETGIRIFFEASDGKTTDNSYPLDLRIINSSCFSYFNYSYTSGAVIDINQSGNINVSVKISGNSTGSFYIMKMDELPQEPIKSFDKLISYYEFATTFGGNETKNLKLYYTDSYLKNNKIKEKWIRAYAWTLDGWKYIETGIDQDSNYASINIGDYSTIGLFSVKHDEASHRKLCYEDWNCTEWSACTPENMKYRTCEDLKDCDTYSDEPKLERKCKYKAPKVTKPKENKIEEPAKVKKGRQALFDIITEVLSEPVEDELLMKVGLLNYGQPGLIIVNLSYTILNSSGEVVYEEFENVEVETQTEFIKSINVSGLKSGIYKIVSVLTYDGQLEPASSELEFQKGISEDTKNYLFGVVMGFMLLLLVIFMVFRKSKKSSVPPTL